MSYFILTVVFILVIIIALIIYKVVEVNVRPLLNSTLAIKFRKRLFNAAYLFVHDVWNDFLGRLKMHSKTDKNLRIRFVETNVPSSPPTEYIIVPPTEETDPENGENLQNAGNSRRRTNRRRAVVEEEQAAARAVAIRQLINNEVMVRVREELERILNEVQNQIRIRDQERQRQNERVQ